MAAAPRIARRIRHIDPAANGVGSGKQSPDGNHQLM